MKKHSLYYNISRQPTLMYCRKNTLSLLQYFKSTTVNVFYEKALSVRRLFKAITVNVLYEKGLSVLQYFNVITANVLNEKSIVLPTIFQGHHGHYTL